MCDPAVLLLEGSPSGPPNIALLVLILRTFWIATHGYGTARIPLRRPACERKQSRSSLRRNPFAADCYEGGFLNPDSAAVFIAASRHLVEMDVSHLDRAKTELTVTGPARGPSALIGRGKACEFPRASDRWNPASGASVAYDSPYLGTLAKRSLRRCVQPTSASRRLWLILPRSTCLPLA